MGKGQGPRRLPALAPSRGEPGPGWETESDPTDTYPLRLRYRQRGTQDWRAAVALPYPVDGAPHLLVASLEHTPFADEACAEFVTADGSDPCGKGPAACAHTEVRQALLDEGLLGPWEALPVVRVAVPGAALLQVDGRVVMAAAVLRGGLHAALVSSDTSRVALRAGSPSVFLAGVSSARLCWRCLNETCGVVRLGRDILTESTDLLRSCARSTLRDVTRSTWAPTMRPQEEQPLVCWAYEPAGPGVTLELRMTGVRGADQILTEHCVNGVPVDQRMQFVRTSCDICHRPFRTCFHGRLARQEGLI